MSVTQVQSVVIEVDPGVDDAWALMILFAAWKLGFVTVLAVVCSNGNTNINQTCENTKKIMDAAHILQSDIPLFSGVGTGVVNETPVDNYFGIDGFGDITPPVKPKPRYVFPGFELAGYLKDKKEEISYLSFGSLTFLMTFLLQQPGYQFKDIWIMGGNNLGTNFQEWNFSVDPEAVHFILRQWEETPLYLATFHNCESVEPTMDWRRNVLGRINTDIITLINKAEAFIINEMSDDDIWYQYDSVLAVAFVYPNAISNIKEIGVNITLGSDLSTRSVLIEGVSKIQSIESLDVETYKLILEESAKILV